MKESIKQKFNIVIETIKNLKHNSLFWICFSLTFLYLSSGYCKWIEISYCLASVIILAILPLQKSLCLYTFLHCFTLSNIGYNSCFIVTFACYSVILLIKYCVGLKKGKFKFHKKIVITLSCFLLVSTVISLFRPLYGGSWMYPAYAVIFYCIFAMRSEFKISEIMNYMFGGILTSCSLAFVCMFLPNYQYNVWFGDSRFTAFINNPNYLNMRVLFALSYYIYRYLNNKLSTFSFAVIFIFCAGISILSQSKAGIVCLAILTILFIVLFLKKDFKKNIKTLGIFAIIFAIFVAIGFKAIAEVVERITSSFESDNMLSLFLTGRDEIWGLYLNAIFKNPFNALFGHGILAQQVFVANQFGPTETHSFYIFLLYRFGIVGTAVLGYIVHLFIKELNYEKPKFINFLPLIYILIISLIDNTMKYNNIFYFLFAIMILFQDHREQKDIDESEENEIQRTINSESTIN